MLTILDLEFWKIAPSSFILSLFFLFNKNITNANVDCTFSRSKLFELVYLASRCAMYMGSFVQQRLKFWGGESSAEGFESKQAAP